MDPDLFLILGLCISALAVPGALSAISESRAPRSAALAVLIGGGMVVLAVTKTPGGYTLTEIPDVFVSVIGRYLN